jgi:hypothetical protein
MKRDLSKYMPDVEKVLAECDPATFDERQRKALAKAHEAGLIDRLTPEPLHVPEPQPQREPEPQPKPDAQHMARVSAPSPWAKGGTGATIDAAALPSATAPKAEADAAPVAAPVKQQTPAKFAPKHVALAVAGGLMVAAAAIGMPMLMERRVQPQAEVMTAAAPAGAGAATGAPPSAATAPSAGVTAAPSASATASAAAAPPRPHGKPRATSDDPYDAAPPQKTAEPAATAPSATAPDAAPTSTRWF